MAYGLSSMRTNKWAMVFYAALAVGWSGWKMWKYNSSDYVLATVEPEWNTPPVELFGGQLQPGNSIELSVPKTEVARLLGFIDVMRYGAIIVGLVIILAGLLFFYRFCNRVIAGNTFTNAARTDVVLIGVCILAYPIITGFMNMLGTNSVAGALELSTTIDTVRPVTGLWIAIAVSTFLQFVYAAITQGTKLARDADGLV
ncbi:MULTISPECIES: hypothetical protein [Rhodococcus]|uniref:DUF2975 domain-containing protein n=1 Tax=Rhodococcus cercidiphylli TaxID=489916 RepID=A0ABU4B262_9NOCA|nr:MULTISPECIES: hypothetical protein [Rhodococcus]MDV6232580.1 hypothetical protein [Rhodococcus cercidiphylli]MDV7989782.1 hypothetical protein [Rhodococcus sp. IEGM 1374]